MSCQNNSCCTRTYQRTGGCLMYAIGFLAILLAFAVGLILGAFYYEMLLPAISAIIAFAAAIAAILIALLIFRSRRCC